SGYQVRVGRVFAFNEECVVHRVQAGFQGVIGVDEGDIHIRQHARQRGGLQFAELQFLRVLGDVARSRQNVGRILQLDQALLLQQEQRPCAVGRVVRDSDLRTV